MNNNYRHFSFTDNSFVITFIKSEFSRTGSGKSWKKAADVVTSEIVTAEFYTNYIQSIPFFNNFGGQAYSRGHKSYTVAGYIPTVINTVDPTGTKKIVARFEFRNK